ncbi:MAG: BON domain-containing protein [Pseudomonadales bacterium]
MISLLRSFLLVTLLAALAACQTYDDPNRRTPGEVTDDTAILTTIKAKLIADPDIQGLSIDVDVYQGVVTLAGRIPSRSAAGKGAAYRQHGKGCNPRT